MFDKREILDLIISTVILAVAFYYYFHTFSFLATLILVFATFVLHEIGHKIVAMYFNCESRYEISYILLLICIIIAIITNWKIIFAAPGYVVSYKSNLTKREEGLISLAGPMTNVLIAILCIYLMHTTNYTTFIKYLGSFNCFVAFFNMLPFYLLDGAKVFEYNKTLWTLCMILILIVFSNFI